jgi:uncharacterized protein YndB with AHSA1/START domain
MTDGEFYSRWHQVPVSIERDLYAATLEWGTKVPGRYEIVLPPQLIVMSWDFDDGNIPVPGHPFPLRLVKPVARPRSRAAVAAESGPGL